MLKKVKVKQGSLAWEKLREKRIGGSEVFDIVRYFASDEELQNCGINAESFKSEKPFTTAWQLYHKVLGDGLYRRAAVEPENAEYGHAVEGYGIKRLNINRHQKVKGGEVFANDKLVASLDVSGVAEELDVAESFVNGGGNPKLGQKFVCEQKTIRPVVLGGGLPQKYIVQAQYQSMLVGAEFFIIQVMVLGDDTAFVRGKICQMGAKKRYDYLDEHMVVAQYYFKNNAHLAALIEKCLERFFAAVEAKNEPRAFIANDKESNIIESIYLNSAFAPGAAKFDLAGYISAKRREDEAKAEKDRERQKLVDLAKELNRVNFVSENGDSAKFTKNGRLLVREATE